MSFTPTIRIRQLQAIEIVLAHRTLTSAAEAFGITQPAMSRLIAQLEEDVGFKLLTRADGQNTLTSEGRIFWREAERVLHAMRQLHAQVSYLRGEGEQAVRIISLPGLIDRLVAKSTAAFAARHPQVRISIEALARAALEREMEQGAFDIALSLLPIQLPREFEVMPLAALSACCILPKGHPLALKDVVRAEDLQKLPFLSLRTGSILRQKIDAHFDALGIHREVNVECQGQDIICEMVSAGAGVSLVLPSSVLQRADVEARLFEPRVTVEYVMVRPRGRFSSKAADDLAARIVAEASEMREVA